MNEIPSEVWISITRKERSDFTSATCTHGIRNSSSSVTTRRRGRTWALLCQQTLKSNSLSIESHSVSGLTPALPFCSFLFSVFIAYLRSIFLIELTLEFFQFT